MLAPSAGDAFEFQVTADGTRVVYRADEGQPGVDELFSILLAPGATSVEIGGVQPALGDVSPGFLQTPDGSRVVYVADGRADELYELFVTPIDGSAAPLRLSGDMVAGGDVARTGALPLIGLAGAADRVVYVADQELNERFELYSVPLDGSLPAVKLNVPPVAGGDVSLEPSGVCISQDGTRVVYLADQEEDGRLELYSTPIDGSGPAVKLSGAMIAGGDVEPGFTALPDAVLFRADRVQDDVIELWLAPLDGGAPPVRRASMAHPLADVQADFQLTPGATHVLYRADALEDGRVELFRSEIERVPRHARR